MQIELRYFASVREKIGKAQETLILPPEQRTVGDVRNWLIAQGVPYAEALAPGRALRMALDQQMCAAETLLHEGAEVAFFPPVTGG